LARQQVRYELNSGVSILNYLGHSGIDRLASEGILQTGDVASLTNAERTPLALFMTCVVGQFAIPNYDSLSEALVMKPNGGAIAVWAPTGLSYNDEAVVLNQAFVQTAVHDDVYRLGDIVNHALRAYAGQSRYTFMRDIYNVLGDPALVWKLAPTLPPDDPSPTTVPEPGTILIMGTGLALLCGLLRKKFRR
jgi:hypothetical protein